MSEKDFKCDKCGEPAVYGDTLGCLCKKHFLENNVLNMRIEGKQRDGKTYFCRNMTNVETLGETINRKDSEEYKKIMEQIRINPNDPTNRMSRIMLNSFYGIPSNKQERNKQMANEDTRNELTEETNHCLKQLNLPIRLSTKIVDVLCDYVDEMSINGKKVVIINKTLIGASVYMIAKIHMFNVIQSVIADVCECTTVTIRYNVKKLLAIKTIEKRINSFGVGKNITPLNFNETREFFEKGETLYRYSVSKNKLGDNGIVLAVLNQEGQIGVLGRGNLCIKHSKEDKYVRTYFSFKLYEDLWFRNREDAEIYIMNQIEEKTE
jgi:hypothetical protein